MAERTVNVRINYQINTVEIQKAQAASLAAQKATDDLRKSVDAYGKGIQKANKDAADSMRQVTASTQSLTGQIGQLYSAVKTVVSAGLVRWAVDTTLEMARLAGNTEAVGRAFSNQIPNSTVLLSRLRDATKGTVTNLELMQRTLKAQNFGIAVERLPTLLEFAHVRAQQTGESIDYMVNSIVDGLGRKSLLKLDNLGISASRLKEEFEGASLQSLTVAQVTEGVSNIVQEELRKMGGAIETAATEADRLVVAFKEMQVEAAKTGEPITRWITKRLTEAAEAAGFISKLVKGSVDNKPEEEVSGESFKAFMKRLMNEESQRTKLLKKEEAERQAIRQVSFFHETNLTKEVLANRQKSLDLVQQEINSQVQLIGRNNDEINAMKERNKLINDQFSRNKEEAKIGSDFFIEEVKRLMDLNNISKKEAKKLIFEQAEESKKAVQFYEFQNLTVTEYIRLLKASRDDLSANNKEEAESLGLVEAKREEIKKLQDQIEKTKDIDDLGGPTGRLTQALEKAQAELKELLEGKNLPPVKLKPIKLDQSVGDKFIKDLEIQINQYQQVSGPLPVRVQPVIAMDNWDKFEKDFKENYRSILGQGFEDTSSFIQMSEQAEIESLRHRLEVVRNHYGERVLLAGDNQRAIMEIRVKEERETAKIQKQIAEREWKAKRNAILLDTAAGIARNIAAYEYPLWILPVAVTAAQGALQLAAADKAKPRFATGVINLNGPGTATSDSIDAKLSKGESVMTAAATRRSMGLLEAIQANKIDDSILKKIDFSGGRAVSVTMDDSRIVDELKSIRKSQYTLERQGNQLYRVYSDREGNKKRVRSKIM